MVMKVESAEEPMETIVLSPRPRPKRPRTRLDAEGRRELLEQHDWVAVQWASRYRGRALNWRINWDDLLQEVRLGLVDAAQHYDPSRGTFPSYSRGYILKRFSGIFQGAYQASHGSGAGLEDTYEAGAPSHAQEIRDLLDEVGDSDLEAVIEQGQLDRKDRAMLEGIRRGFTQAEIAFHLGCGLSTVQSRQRALIAKLDEIASQ